MLQLGWTTARLILGMSWKAVQKAYPKVSKKVFNQIKSYKNKKNLEKKFIKEKKLDKPKKKVKPKVIKKETIKPKKINVATTTAANLGKEVKNLANIVNKLTLGVVPATGKQFVKAPLKTTAIGAGTTWGVSKAIDIGKKLFSGRAMTDTGNGQDIKSEVTGGGTTETKGPPLSGGAEGLNNFVNAHNEALASGKSHFVFQGKHFNVGKTQLSQF